MKEILCIIGFLALLAIAHYLGKMWDNIAGRHWPQDRQQ